MKYVKRTIEECIRGDGQFDPYANENIVHFRACDLKIYHRNSNDLGKDSNEIYRHTPDHPDASRSYEMAINSHQRFHVNTSRAYAAAYTDYETDEDREYAPEEIYKAYEDKLMSLSQLPLPPKLNINFDSILDSAILAPGDTWAGFFSMLNPVTCWKTMDRYAKGLFIFGAYQYLAFLIPALFTLEYYTIWQVFLLIGKLLKAICN
ncbi:MAG: hypothetical protein BWY74_00303 [Firmicutes bacterium ADurb.Bin419]|jgi:hypothetical protein|nr:MAG: hypothetical protein BWY74_00303 [Firmicutes bacterium ADurb.Bin419]